MRTMVSLARGFCLLLGLVSGAALGASPVAPDDVLRGKASGPDAYIIRLAGEPVAAYAGGIPGLPATAVKRGSGARFDAKSPAALAYDGHLRKVQDGFLERLTRELGRSPTVHFTYRHALNGLAVTLSPAEASLVARMPGVEAVERNRIEQLQTDVGAEFIGATDVWGGGIRVLGYRVELSGDNEVPPVSTVASGSGTLNVDLATGEVQYFITLNGITPTAAHIHLGAAGTNGPINATLSIVGNTLQGTVTLMSGQLAAMANEGLYVNVHSGANPGGEIRDQMRIAGTLGEGTIVGVIDTGINFGHPSFATVAGDGYQHQNPFGPGVHIGFCASNPGLCTDKLIGAWSFVDGDADPTDIDGHGSHTAGTAAGNILGFTTVDAVTPPLSFPRVAGVAPRANIIAYKVCSPSCPSTATIAAVNQAIQDGVDVINYSISGGVVPYADNTSLAFRNAVAAGIVVAASAGNSGPTPATVGHQEPWVMTVAASTHNREVLNTLQDLSSSGGGLANIVGQSPTGAYDPAPIVYAGAAPYNNPLCDSFAPGTFSGQIVVCDRGSFGRVQKGQNVLAGGGGAMVLANDLPSSASLSVDSHVLPAVHISHADGLVLKSWLASGSNHAGRISGRVVSTLGLGDAMAAFSSRGPAGAFAPAMANIIKPDVSGPGMNIVAPFRAGFGSPPEFNFLSGTSMSSPHLAGSAALMRALFPDWTPAEIKSALMMSSVEGLRKEDDVSPTDPFDRGSGGVELGDAPSVGFVMDISDAQYVAANPATGGDPGALNLPSGANAQCISDCSWTRTLRSVATDSRDYSVNLQESPGVALSVVPSTFSLAPAGTQVIEITADVVGAVMDTWQFAEVAIVPDGGGVTQRLPIAVRPMASSLPGRVRIDADASTGTTALDGIRALAISELTSAVRGLVQGDVDKVSLPVDPSNGDPYNGDGGTFVVLLDVPLGARRLIAEIVQSESSDADLYVGTGDTPSAATQMCSSATSSAIEYCNVTDPAQGTWWVLVQNWAGSGSPPDLNRLVTAVVGHPNSGNFSITGPIVVAAGEPFGVDMNWNDAGILPGTYWYGEFDLGTDAGNPGNLGRVGVDLVRIDPDALFADGFESP